MGIRDLLVIGKDHSEKTTLLNQGESAEEDAGDRLFRHFNLYFPHLRLPEILVEETTDGYTAKLLIFNGEIETNKSYLNSSDAMEYVFTIGYKVVCGMVEGVESMKARQKQICNNKNPGILSDEKSRKGIFSKKRDNQQKRTEKEDKVAFCGKSTDSEQPFQLSSHKGRNQEESRSIISSTANNSFVYSKYVHDYCLNNRIVFPEYTIEKQNGVYICSAVFIGETFESKYSFDQKGAKEDVCRLIYNHLRQKMPHKTAESMSNKTRNTKRVKHGQGASYSPAVEQHHCKDFEAKAQYDSAPSTFTKLEENESGEANNAGKRRKYESDDSVGLKNVSSLDLENLSETWTNFGSISGTLDRKKKGKLNPKSYTFNELFK